MKKSLLYTYFLLLIPLLGMSQNQDIFFANANSLQVVQGTTVKVDFIMNNIKGSNFKAPPFTDFQVISGPSQTSSYSNVNGSVTQQFAYAYVLRPKRAGKLIIGAATCVHNGQQIRTSPITITAVERDSKSLQALGLPSDEDIFVRQELSTDTAFLGEKVQVLFKLYTRQEVRSFDIKSESDYAGFYVRPARAAKSRSVIEEIDGKKYSTQILERRLLYPQQTGTFEFEASNITLGLPDPNRRNSGFFFNSSNKAFPVVTNPAKLVVKNLPAGGPSSFSGAVGRFSMQASVDKQKLSTDDALTLIMTVMGNGDAKYILPASQEHIEDFEFYDPDIIEKGEQERFGELQTIKQFKYLVVPEKAGRQRLQVEYTYFNTDSSDYVTLRSQVFPLMVEQGSAKRSINLEEDDSSERNLTGLMEARRLKKKSRTLFGGPLHISFLGLGALAVGLVFWKKRQVDIEAGIDPTVKKRNKAKSVAVQRLSGAEKHMESGEHRKFYEEINKSLLGFIADKINVQNSEISKSNVATRLGEIGISDEKIVEITDVLAKCEVAIFAGKKDGHLEEIYASTRDLIEFLSDKL